MVLGVDFGYYSIKAVVLNNGKIHALGEKRLVEDYAAFDPDKMETSHWIAAFQSLCESLSIKPKKMDKVVTSISGSKVSIKPITTLEMEESELINTLTLEAKKHVPLDGSDPVIDYHILGQNPKEIDKVDLVMVATTQKIIRAHNLIVKDCNLKNPIFDSDPIALLNCYKYNYEAPKDDVDVLVNIGFLTTTILVYGENQELFTREISTGGHHITSDIMKLKSMDYGSAETNKLNEGIKIFDSDDENASSIQISQRNILSELSDEVRKTLRYYMKSKTGISYNKFYISGGSAKMEGLTQFLNTSLNVEFQEFNPFNELSDVEDDKNPLSYIVSVGLALRA